jgi:hypothetical protein
VIVNFVDLIRSSQDQDSRRIEVDEPIDGMASQRRLSEWFHPGELLPAASGIMVQPSERRPNVSSSDPSIRARISVSQIYF